MFKTVNLMKRRPDISHEEFVRRYETGHAVLGARLLRGSAVHYVRRYLKPVPNYETGETVEPEYDAIMEIWYPDRATWEATMARLTRPETMAEIIADEETLFDRAAMRFYLVDEQESDMSSQSAGS